MPKQKRNGPVIITSSEVEYENPWIRVVEDKVIHSEKGKEGIYGIMEAKNKGGISVLPMDVEGNVYLAYEFRYTLGRKIFNVVTGFIDEGEAPRRSAKRELKEELGINAKKITPLGVTESISILKIKQYLFLAEDLEFHSAHPESFEEIVLIKKSLQEAVDMVMSGKIISPPACVLILKAWHYLQKNNYATKGNIGV